MAVHTRANSIDGLTDVDGNLIQIAERVAADFVGERPNGPTTEGQVDRHSLLRRDKLRRLARPKRWLKDVFGDVPYDRHADAIPADMISVVIALREHVIVAQPHEPRSLARRQQARAHAPSFDYQNSLT